ncbi:MAG: type II toxin-antitoxin system PemK/MazF family toxin [Terriglobales bacterium]
MTPLPTPSRGEIWFAKLPTDPSDKSPRPVIVVSVEARNANPRASTVMVIPLSTTPKRAPTHVELAPGETGLAEYSIARTEDLSLMRKEWMLAPRQSLRRITDERIRQMAAGVLIAMGCSPLPAASTERP